MEFPYRPELVEQAGCISIPWSVKSRPRTSASWSRLNLAFARNVTFAATAFATARFGKAPRFADVGAAETGGGWHALRYSEGRGRS